MLLGPVQIDLAGAHGVERAFHADRADIGMGQHDGDEDQANKAMHDLCDLHVPDGRCEEREQQQHARDRERHAAKNDRPENQLLDRKSVV